MLKTDEHFEQVNVATPNVAIFGIGSIRIDIPASCLQNGQRGITGSRLIGSFTDDPLFSVTFYYGVPLFLV